MKVVVNAWERIDPMTLPFPGVFFGITAMSLVIHWSTLWEVMDPIYGPLWFELQMTSPLFCEDRQFPLDEPHSGLDTKPMRKPS